MEIALKVIDYFLLDGWKIFFGVILALLKFAEGYFSISKQMIERLIHMKFEDAIIYLKSFVKDNIIDEVICGDNDVMATKQ